MKQFMLIIRNKRNHLAHLSPPEEKKFLEACMDYISKLKKDGKLISAQPMKAEGKIISRADGKWKEGPFNESSEFQVGYYHILAKDLDDAVELAKGNPEFEYTDTARIEVRELKIKEETTGYEYPNS